MDRTAGSKGPRGRVLRPGRPHPPAEHPRSNGASPRTTQKQPPGRGSGGQPGRAAFTVRPWGGDDDRTERVRVSRMGTYVYDFTEGNKELKDLLGGKGAGLAEMTRLGLPVPPGFTITTEACLAYMEAEQLPDGLMEDVMEHLVQLEDATGKRLGDPGDPLLVSVRSGAAVSMPGMMDTVLNLGLNDTAVEGLARRTGDERFAYDSYRRLIQMFGDIVLKLEHGKFEEALEALKEESGVEEDPELSAEDLKGLIVTYKKIVEDEADRRFPE